jgi:hypothetical protein
MWNLILHQDLEIKKFRISKKTTQSLSETKMHLVKQYFLVFI